MDALILFKALSNPIRLRLVALLAEAGELCVCELTEVIGLPQPKVSHHLGLLKSGDIVNDCKKGQWSFYKINNDSPEWVKEIIEGTLSGIKDTPPYRDDANLLTKMSSKKQSLCQ